MYKILRRNRIQQYSFVQALNGRNVMVVGDSLQEEMFFSFLSALRATFLMDSSIDRANYSEMYVCM